MNQFRKNKSEKQDNSEKFTHIHTHTHIHTQTYTHRHTQAHSHRHTGTQTHTDTPQTQCSSPFPHSFNWLRQALATIQRTRALDHTYEYLVSLRAAIQTDAEQLQIQSLLALLARLSFSAPHPAPTEETVESFRPTKAP